MLSSCGLRRRVGILLVTVSIWVASFESSAHANIWFVDSSPDTRSLAYMPASQRLIIGSSGGLSGVALIDSLNHDISVWRLPLYLNLSVNDRTGQLGELKSLATFASGEIVTLLGSTVYVWKDNGVYAQVLYSIPLGLRNRVIDSTGADVRIAPLSIVTNGDHILISGYQINDLQNRDSSAPKKYSVWELWYDGVDECRVTTLATGPAEPILLSANSSQPNLLVHQSEHTFQLQPEAKGKLSLVAFAPTIPTDVAAFEFANITSMDRFDDGTILLTENVNNRVWRLGVDAKTLTALAGCAGARDTRKTNPLEFVLAPSAVAAASDGAFFVFDGPNIRFVGPNDQLEDQLSVLFFEADGFARSFDYAQGSERLVKLQALCGDGSGGMRQVRARIALNALKRSIGQVGYDRLTNAAKERLKAQEQAAQPATTVPQPKVQKDKKSHRKHKFCCC